jgi:glycosyltransferase involved in cell wall biosynthesis
VISVLLPFRNARATLPAALASVLAEPEVNEVIAIDDGSTDGAASAIDHRRVVVTRTEGVGVARALEHGLKLAKGEWIARMDADDISLPGRFDATLRRFASDASLAVVGTLVEVDERTGPGMRAYVAWQNSLVSPDEHARDMFVESTLCHPSTTIRRRALEAVGGWRDVDWPEDWDLWLRLTAAGHSLAKASCVGLIWSHREGRATTSDARCRSDRLLAARAHHLAARLHREGRAITIWGAGKTGRRLARALEPYGIRPARFVDIDPKKIGNHARGTSIVAADTISANDREIVIVAVGDAGARDVVRARLLQRGFVEGLHFICAA